MKAGIRALASLTGEPLNPTAREKLGFAAAALPGELRYEANGFAVRLWDPQAGALDLLSTAHETVAFAGYLDEAEALAGLLGMPAATGPATLAAEALGRFGVEAAGHMLGEWTVLRWAPDSRCVTLLSSRARRDTHYFLRDHRLLAIAPEAMLLGRLSANGLAIDPSGLALTLCRANLRSLLGDATGWHSVKSLQPGTQEVISARGRATSHCGDQEASPAFHGSFGEAVEMLDAVGRRVMRQHMQRHGRIAFLLSGGQDSTLLTAWGALEHAAGQAPVTISSVAPPGSGLADESAFSEAAARELGLEWKPGWPAAEADLFRPGTHMFAFAEGPNVGNRAATYEALFQAAKCAQASVLIDGAFGEETLTGGMELPAMASWNSFLDVLRTWKHRDRQTKQWPVDAFHVRFSSDFLHGLPTEWKQVWERGSPAKSSAQSDRIGISRGLSKGALTATAEADGLRRLYPYRDRRLVAAAASLPRAFQTHDRLTRALSRRLLQGRVPEAVRLRTVKLPFSPDFLTRLRRQAPVARARVQGYWDAGLGDWLNLEWLSVNLEVVVRGQDLPYGLLYTIQQTAITAEFLLWARRNGASDPLCRSSR